MADDRRDTEAGRGRNGPEARGVADTRKHTAGGGVSEAQGCRCYAVLTGDVVGSSAIVAQGAEALLQAISIAAASVAGALPRALYGGFDIYRGDSFQGILMRPSAALEAAVVFRASLRSTSAGWARSAVLDARIAVGIGPVSFLPSPHERPSLGQGEAFVRSGELIDRMKAGDDRLLIETPLAGLNEELAGGCALLDALIRGWSARQSAAVLVMLSDAAAGPPGTGQASGRTDPIPHRRLTQSKAAEILGIGQSTLSQHLRAAGYSAVRRFLDTHEKRLAAAFVDPPAG